MSSAMTWNCHIRKRRPTEAVANRKISALLGGMVMKKMTAIVLVLVLILSFALTGCGPKNAERTIGYSALYSEELINEAFNIIEKEFTKSFKGCTLKELRYDDAVENRFAEEIARYATVENKELIVVLSTFETDSKGGDGSLNPNETYTDWQWRLVRTENMKSWELVDWGY